MIHLNNTYNFTFIILILISGISFYGSKQPEAKLVEDVIEEYCNSRFQFCFEYPAYIFVQQFESDNGDGVYLTNWDKSAEMWVGGVHNEFNQSLEEAHDVLVRDVEEEGSGVRERLSIWKDGFYETNIKLFNGHQIHIRSFQKRDVIVTGIIKISDPVNIPIEVVIQEFNFELTI